VFRDSIRLKRNIMMSQDSKINSGLNATNSQFDDEIDLGKLLATLIDGRIILAVCTALFAILGFGFGLLATPVYLADALIQYEDKAPSIPGFDDMSQIFSAESSSNTEIEIIKSRLVIGAVVDELKLTVDVTPRYFPLVGAAIARKHSSAGLADSFFGSSYAWGGEELELDTFVVSGSPIDDEIFLVAEGGPRYSVWVGDKKTAEGSVGENVVSGDQRIELKVTNLLAHKGTEFEITITPRQSAITKIQKDLRVSEKGKDTGIIVLAMEGVSQERITGVIDAVSANYYFQNIQRMAAEAEKSLEFLSEQIPRVKQELLNSEIALHEYRAERSSVDLSLETQSALQTLVQIEADISTMAIGEAEISRNFTSNHPNYISFRRQQANLIGQRDKLLKKLESLPDTQQVILRLMRDFEVNQGIYLALQNKFQELSVIKASTVGSVRILDKAQVSGDPVAPKRALILILASLLGGMLGMMIVFARAALKRGVTDPKVFDEIGLNVQAIVPLSETEALNASRAKGSSLRRSTSQKSLDRDGGFILAQHHPADLSVEALRSLRTSLHFAMLGATNNVVMVTSANPGVGKSFITSNLAALIASQGGKRILLVDSDLRKGYMHSRFGLKLNVGLSEALAGAAEWRDLVRSTSVDGLDVMTRGAVPSNPSELLMGRLFGDFIHQASEEYDLIILDTPPILAVTDPAIIGVYAATSLIIARFELCSVKQISSALRRFELSGIEIKGLVFNAVEKKSSGYYYDYGYYNYDYNSDN